MSKYFVDGAPVPIYEFDPSEVISDRPPNVIYIRSKMNTDIKGQASSALLKVVPGKDVESHLGEHSTALLIFNIVKWEGPDLDGVPCDEAHIRNLDPTEPHIVKVLEEIALRNAPQPSPNPKLASASGATNAGEPSMTVSESLAAGNGIPRLRLQSAISGHLNKSDG